MSPASSNALRGRERVWRRLNAQEGKRHFCKRALRTASEDEAEAQLYEVLADLEEMEKEAGIDPRPHKKRKKSPTVRLKKRNQEGFLIYDQRNPKTDQAGGSQPVLLTNAAKSGIETLTAYVGREPAASEELFRDINTEEVIDSQLQILQDALNCDDIAPRPTASHDWSLRRSQSEDRWCAARPELVDSLLAGECVQRGVCNRCRTKQAVIRCKDCFPMPFYCGSCDISTHKHLVLHNRETINNFYKPVPPSTVVNDVNGQNVLYEQVCLVPMTLPDNICGCEPQVLSIDPGQSAILITINGRYDLFLPILTCKTCLATWTPEMGDLVRNGYWPGSVTLQTIFHIDVFTSLEDLKITAPGLSRQAFVEMLEQRSRHFGRNSTICGDHLQKAFLEWTHCRHEKEKLMGIDHFSCPACTPNTLAVSADGNRKLYRFRKTKGVEQKAFFDGVFISNDKEVSDFVDCVRDKIKPVHGRGVCGTSRWAAARESSKTNPKVDEEGLEVAVCRHSLLLKALNMYRGEIFAYPMYLQKELAARTTCTYFCTDVMCQYWPYLQRVAKALPNIQNLLQMTPLLSAMHAKGHATKCEIQWGGKNQSGAGTTIGEEAEQANSFLSRVAITTKHMTKSARIDMITIHARGWNLRKKARLHKYLSTRYMKTIKQKDQAQEDIEAIKRDTRRSDEELQQWVTDVRQWAVDSLDDVRTDDPVGLQNLIEGLFLGVQEKTRDLYRVNARNKLRHKQRKQIVEDKKRLSEAISQYNNLATTTKSVASIEELLATDSPIWPWDCDTDISINKKKKVFDKMMELERLAEEETILVEEMKQHWSSLIRSSRDLRDQAEALSEDLINQSYPSGLSAQAYHGLHSAILFKLEELKTDMAAVKDTYQHMVLSRGGENIEDSEDEVDDEDDYDEDDNSDS